MGKNTYQPPARAAAAPVAPPPTPAPTPAATPKAKAAELPVLATALRIERVGDGDWQLIEDSWSSAPSSSRIVKRGPRSVLGDFARLWFRELVGSGGTGKTGL